MVNTTNAYHINLIVAILSVHDEHLIILLKLIPLPNYIHRLIVIPVHAYNRLVGQVYSSCMYKGTILVSLSLYRILSIYDDIQVQKWYIMICLWAIDTTLLA